MEITLLDIALRLLCATLIGFAVGVEREWIHRPAGMRTHMVVAVGACVVIMTGEQIFLQSGQYGAWSDPDHQRTDNGGQSLGRGQSGACRRRRLLFYRAVRHIDHRHHVDRSACFTR